MSAERSGKRHLEEKIVVPARTRVSMFAAALASADLNSLQNQLAIKIAGLLRDGSSGPGDRIVEDRLATKLGVSRTPVRAALEFLAAHGWVERQKYRGFVLLEIPPAMPEPVMASGSAAGSDDGLLVQIASDRRVGKLPDQVSEQELMLAYRLSRVAAKKILARLEHIGLVERGLALRYRFVDQDYGDQIKRESFRFRLMVEPASLLEPGFSAPREWVAQLKDQHEAFLSARWTRASSVAFFEMNLSFHEGLLARSGNRFATDTLHRINQRRRLDNYDWRFGRDRFEQSCREHIAILEAIQKAKMTLAARLMREHLTQAEVAPVLAGE